uniref:Similar to phosphoribosylformylglycinamidine synthase n=1 Tax=Arundo donax TaxID=35708 RepID=A0A0A9G954_ARUDO
MILELNSTSLTDSSANGLLIPLDTAGACSNRIFGTLTL